MNQTRFSKLYTKDLKVFVSASALKALSRPKKIFFKKISFFFMTKNVSKKKLEIGRKMRVKT